MFSLAAVAALLLPVPEKAVEKLPAVLVDVAPAQDGGAWVLARDDRYGDPELWRLTAAGAAERVALPDPDGRRLEALAASPSGDEVWLLSHRSLLRLDATDAAGGWTAVPTWVAGGDLKRAAVVPLGRGRAAWVAEIASAEGAPRLVGEIVVDGASAATFSLGCAFRGAASGDGTGALVLGGVGRIAPSPGSWLGSYAGCGEPAGSGVEWQRAPLPPPSRVVAANGPALWHWQGDVLKNGDADAFTLPAKSDGGQPLKLAGAAPGADGRVWVGVLGYTKKSAVTLLSLGSSGVEATFPVAFPRWWKAFLRAEPITLREGAGRLWVLQTYPGKASILLRRDVAGGTWRAFYGTQVKERVKRLKKPEATHVPGHAQQEYRRSYSCLSPISACLGGGAPPPADP